MLRQLGADEVVSDGDGLTKAGGADVILVTGNSWKAAGDAMKGLRPHRDETPLGKGLHWAVLGSPAAVAAHLRTN